MKWSATLTPSRIEYAINNIIERANIDKTNIVKTLAKRVTIKISIM
jgi:hypothetical protein